MNRVLRIGIFTAVGLFAIVAFSVYVNDHPYWYRACNEVRITVDDATGLRRKSPVKTLGLDIGYIKSVDLGGDQVNIQICVTGPVELIKDETRAYVRSPGFLGEKFLELKPVKKLSTVAWAMEGAKEPWVKKCENEIKIKVDDAQGLRRKSPIRSLGIEVGYINSIDLDGEEIMVKACLNDQVKMRPETQAHVRASGFLGDKFLELKPIDMQGSVGAPVPAAPIPASPAPNTDTDQSTGQVSPVSRFLRAVADWLVPSAYAAEEAHAASKDEPTLSASREVELQDTMKKVGKLVDQLTLMVGDLREVTAQKDFKETISNLNASMKHLKEMLNPDGKMMKNMQSSMESLKNTMAAAEAVMNKIKEGEGSVGKFINDPSLYDDIRAAIQSVNLLLGKAGLLRTYVDIGAWKIPVYNGSRGFLRVTIAPNPTRYYLLGVSNDPRGHNVRTTTTTTVNGSATTIIEDKNTEKGLSITALFGKYFGPLDLSVGLVEDNGAIGVGYWFDPARRFGVHVDVYSQGTGKPIETRAYAKATLYSSLYVTGGVDAMHNYTGVVNGAVKTSVPWFVGAGFYFDDDDLKYLLAFK